MVNFRSLVPNGFYSSTPTDKSTPVSIRCNNPGALNVAQWIKAYPGYVGDKVTSHSGASPNSTVIFETPEHGVAAWWELMRRYAAAGATTVGLVIQRYGGGQDYSAYVTAVEKWARLKASDTVNLHSDTTLLPFARAMFRYEAGRETPLTDAQILYGFAIGRNKGLEPATGKPVGEPKAPGPTPGTPRETGWSFLDLFWRLITRK